MMVVLVVVGKRSLEGLIESGDGGGGGGGGAGNVCGGGKRSF